MSTTRKASRNWTRHKHRPEAHGDKKYYCEKGRHVKGCRVSRPLCKHRRVTCRCEAVPWPHRAGSLPGCRAGGIPDAVLKSRSYRESAAFSRSGWRSRMAARGARRRS
jgi:hypothetical protein